ncbi:MAG: hypothetical protein IKE29_19750, partial [Paenibacillus sp.]|uniref:hypothetical protein n=1 Tax=Paenibacillus sp. TaxID=58172 RepID=UPI0025DAD38F
PVCSIQVNPRSYKLEVITYCLTNSTRFLLRRTAHRADASLVCPIDVNDVLSHHGRNYKPLSKP